MILEGGKRVKHEIADIHYCLLLCVRNFQRILYTLTNTIFATIVQDQYLYHQVRKFNLTEVKSLF